MGKLSKFIRHRGRPYELSSPNGEGTVRIQFYEGYVVLISSQPGLKFRQEVAITRSAWWRLMKQVSKPTVLMQGPDFDRYVAERESYQAELLRLSEKRVRRREEVLEAKRAAQRRRYESAKKRPKRT
jgi:hypothetical protein